ncbi:MAG: undecaprenyl/decaprenyl-phosphate alpha-N-acetylglucosaminyl 1-phosphate transferase [Clostridiales Family XIII bacterium]|jgi:UDP-GlcNAc:undecaprenyl-phosphate GlcNAc-1-phosphate transferase|nr:undecaprenyl/decaprenyl-phosphate alpha-N-acetylglucosaminyl 1-phosphate transferase [Clostridiales Family XIII bacterium]
MTELQVLRIITAACIVIPFVVTFAATPVSMRVAKAIGAIDVPSDKRRMHDKPVPCFGGMALFAGVVVTLLLIKAELFPRTFIVGNYSGISADTINGLIAGGAVIFVAGVIDDVRGMRPLAKLAMQIAGATVAFLFGVRMDTIKLLGLNMTDGSAGNMAANFIITIIWIVAIVNMINLIDGMDGLAAGVVGISSLAIAYAGYLRGYYDLTLGMCTVAGSSFGFLPFNFYPAKSFMGDSGAMFLGFMLASVSVMSQTKSATIVAIIVPVVVLGVPLFDVIFAVFRRLLRGQSILSADKSHLHHLISHIGMGQRRTVLMLYGVTSVMGVAAILLSRDLLLEAIFLFGVAILFIIVLIWKWNVKDR